MSDEVRRAPHDTRLGRLQRGRGAGCLDALAAGEAAFDDVTRCVVEDPRVDRQIESRDAYYASLIVRLEIPLAPIVRHLDSLEDDPHDLGCELGYWVMAHAWLRNHAEARRLPREHPESRATVGLVEALKEWPEAANGGLPRTAVEANADALARRDWLADNVSLHAGFWRGWADIPSVGAALELVPADPPPPDLSLPAAWADGSLTTQQLLDAVSSAPVAIRRKLPADLLRRTTEEDRACLARNAESADSASLVVAARALGEMGDARLLPLAEAHFGRAGVGLDLPPDLPRDFRARRSALLRYVAELPGSATLPLARAWHARGAYFQTAAGQVLARHAEPSDRAWLEAFVEANLADGGGWNVCAEIDALVRIGSELSMPILAGVAERVEYSWARRRALVGLAAFPDAILARSALREALWDCEDESRELACNAALDGDSPRLREIADDELEEESVRMAARLRLGAGA